MMDVLRPGDRVIVTDDRHEHAGRTGAVRINDGGYRIDVRLDNGPYVTIPRRALRVIRRAR